MSRAAVVVASVASVVLLGTIETGTAGAAPAVLRTEPVGGEGVIVHVRVVDNVFKPKKLTVLPGTTVRWTNRGRTEHNVLPNKGSRFGSDDMAPGSTYEHEFAKPGRYAYYCSFHGAPGVGQHATIAVVRQRPKEA